jgi:hypothetical protein
VFETYMVVEAGFMNVHSGTQVSGFQVRSRIANWRGMPLSLIEDMSVTVDGERFGRELLKVFVAGREYRLDDMKDKVDARWQFDEVVTITVDKPGGLAAGLHDVAIAQKFRTGLAAMGPGLSIEQPPSVGKRRMTLVA